MVLPMTPLSFTDQLLGALFFLIPLFMWLIPVLMAISNLQKRNLDETAKATWVLIILLFPIVGAAIFWLMQRKESNLLKK